MLILLSPAKSLNFSESSHRERNKHTSLPQFMKEAEYIVKYLKRLSSAEIQEKLSLSKNLADLNFFRFQNWKNDGIDERTARHAIFAFDGDVYKKFNALSLSESSLEFSQKHIRILSGLYGLLKPYDLIQPYRLEMGSRLLFDHGSLYDFWSQKITSHIEFESSLFLSNKKDSLPVIVNLASQEYFKVINQKNINNRIVTPIFQDYKNGKYRIVSFNAKRARGLMARFICSSQCQDLDEMKLFDLDQYKFDNTASSDTTWFFRRDIN